jgi:hypothetical protein
MVWIFVALMVSYIRIERDEEEPKSSVARVTSADLDIILTKENEQNEVPRRRYVRAPRVRRKDFDDDDEMAKEFDEELDIEPLAEEFEIEEKKEASTEAPYVIPLEIDESYNEGGDELKNEEE